MKHRLLSIAVWMSVGLVAFAGSGSWFYLTHHETVSVSAQFAEVEFSQLRSRFRDRKTLLRIGQRETTDGPERAKPVTPLHSFHTVIFDTRGGQRIVRITVPYWFGHLFADRSGEFRWLGQLTFLDDTEFDPDPIRLSLTQLERRGPGLIADVRHASGGQLIAWVE